MKHSNLINEVMTKLMVYGLWLSALLFLGACNNSDPDPKPTKITGTGQFTYADYAPFSNKPITCYYHIPTNSTSATPILIVVPGSTRAAELLRDALVNRANTKKFMVLALLFPEDTYTGVDEYNMANIFQDGDNPTPSTLLPEEEWTFSIIDPVFSAFKDLTGSTVAKYDVFGHSAGAAMIHRYLLFQPDAKFDRLVSSAAGWYCVPDSSIEFPYGLGGSPAATEPPMNYFEREVYVICGANDTDPNAASLRHTPEADAQGLFRLARAQYFFQESSNIATAGGYTFNWQYETVPDVAHNGEELVNYAASLLY